MATSSDGSVIPLTTATLTSHVACETSDGYAYADVTSSIPTSLVTYVAASAASVVRSTAPGATSSCNYCWHVGCRIHASTLPMPVDGTSLSVSIGSGPNSSSLST